MFIVYLKNFKNETNHTVEMYRDCDIKAATIAIWNGNPCQDHNHIIFSIPVLTLSRLDFNF
ncbi:hypothetical protein BpHYR1_044574 [Brachionus plicatilis]|uniref:Uncharacterized protein n=1 Tax=Brachionus plicatilis TaxID=10195 RepID=A0A3M7R155_BRAPC|nr:hypothetical protein BpHYR1_044574 [Brachionus plicatilis]